MMIYSPKFIVYFTSVNYLDEDSKKLLNQELKDAALKRNDLFIKILKKYIDFELFLKRPFYKEDILVYNYLQYEIKGTRLKNHKLIAKYEKEIIVPYFKEHANYRKELFENGIYYLLNA